MVPALRYRTIHEYARAVHEVAVNQGSCEDLYQLGCTEWDIGGPQEPVRQLASTGAITGRVLDAGCGTGWNAIELARTGCEVVAVDDAPTAIATARGNAQHANVSVNFVQSDVTNLNGHGLFDHILDSMCYNVLPDDARRQYAQTLHEITRPGASWYIYAFGPGTIDGYSNPRFLEKAQFEEVLPTAGWDITYCGPTTFLSLARLAGVPVSSHTVPIVEVHAMRSANTNPLAT